MTRPGGLSRIIARSGRQLLVRQVAVMILALVGVVALTRLIGPSSYGVYVAAFGIAFLAQTLAEFNLDVYIVRHEGKLSLKVCHQVFTLLAVSAFLAVAVLMVLLLLTPLGYLVDGDEYFNVALVMFAGVPLVQFQQVPLSLLERELDYRHIGIAEVVAQALFVASSVGFALAGAGVWSPVAGWYLQQLVLLTGYWRAISYRPRFIWDRELIYGLLRFGTTATSATIAYSTRNLVAPVVVGGMLGPAALGYVALAIRLLEQASFARNIVTRMAYAVMGRVAGEPRRMSDALTRAMEVQVLAVGVPVSLLSLASPYIVPAVFGESWAPLAQIVPLLVPGILVVAMFSGHVAALLGRATPWEVVLANLLNGALMWVLALLFVPTFGLAGYAFADLTSVLAWLVLGFLYARHHRSPNYRFAGLWVVALTMVGFSTTATLWLLPAGLLMAFNPLTVRRIRVSIVPILRHSVRREA